MLYEYMKNLGYTDEEIKKIVNAKPLVKYSEIELYDKIDSIFNWMLLFGYKNEDIRRISLMNLRLFNWNIEMIKRKLNNLLELGYTKEQVINMIVKCPLLFVLSEDNVREKSVFYKKIGLSDIIIKHPVYFIQSIDLSYARYVFYHRMGMKITRGNSSLLFLNQNNFVRRFGKTDKQLIKLYNYDEYLEKCKTRARKVK